jgi:hypothetical protein
VGRVVLGEGGEQRQLAGLDRAAARNVTRGPDQDEGRRHRKVVGRHDPRRAAHQIGPDRDGPGLPERRAREWPVEQIARQHEEHHERHARLEQQQLAKAVALQLDSVRKLVDPHVDSEHEQGRQSTQAIKP